MFSEDQAALAAADLTEALLHPKPGAPFSIVGETQLELLRQLAILFQARINRTGAPARVKFTASHPVPPRVNTHALPRVK